MNHAITLHKFSLFLCIYSNLFFLRGSPFNNNVVGKALKGPICTFEFSGGVNVDHSKVVGMVATTIAHEMGHNLGMEHDNETDNTCKCPKERCIMAPSSRYETKTFFFIHRILLLLNRVYILAHSARLIGVPVAKNIWLSLLNMAWTIVYVINQPGTH